GGGGRICEPRLRPQQPSSDYRDPEPRGPVRHRGGPRGRGCCRDVDEGPPPGRDLGRPPPPLGPAPPPPLHTPLPVCPAPPPHGAKATLLRKFIFYGLTSGQAFGPKLGFAPIPRIVLVAAEKTLAQVK